MTLQSPLPILFSTEPTKDFAEQVAAQLGVLLSNSGFVRFASTEIKVALEESVRGESVFVFGTHPAPVHDAIMQQLILIDAAKRASAAQVTAVCPYLGYGRQDRKSRGREPITSKLLCDMLRVAGADRIVTIDMHSGQSQGFFDGPFDHLIARPAIERHIREHYLKSNKKPIMVSPDTGRTKQTERYANRLGLDMAIVHKDRKATNKATAIALMGRR
jgi:ribose-phosphate pyrophosphokinase